MERLKKYEIFLEDCIMTKICSAGKMRLAVAFAVGMVLCGLKTWAEVLTVR
jgi:hypothetical protein